MLKNFKTIIPKVDVSRIRAQLDEHPELWDQHRIRTSFNGGKPFGSCSDIILQYNDLERKPIDWIETVPYPAMYILTEAQQFVHAMMAMMLGDRLGRVMITRLPPGEYIGAHSDDPNLCRYYNRFHLCLADNDKTEFVCGSEVYRPQPGEFFWFDNSKIHSVWNFGDTDRLTLICDIKKKTMKVFYGEQEAPVSEADRLMLGPQRLQQSNVDPTITYAAERFSEAIPELKAIIPQHYRELALDHDEVPLDPDWDRYCQTENMDALHFYTARKEGKLIGYVITLIGGHLHYKSTIHGAVDIYYILPEYRRSGVGREFFAFWELDLRDAKGVKKIVTGTKLHESHEQFWTYMGFRKSDTMMIKILKAPTP